MTVRARLQALIWRVPVGLQLSALYTLLFIATLSLLGWALYSQLNGFLVQNTGEQLERSAVAVLSRGLDFERGINRNGGRGPGPGSGSGTPVAEQPEQPRGDAFENTGFAAMVVRELSAPDITVAVFNTNGVVITSTLTFDGVARTLPPLPEGWSKQVPAAQPDSVSKAAWWMVPADGGRQLLVAQGVNFLRRNGSGQQAILVQAASLNSVDVILSQLQLYLALGVLIGTVVGVLVVLWLTRSVLRPLDRMSRTAEAIAAGDLNRRLRLPDGQNEVARLGGAFDHMVDRLAASLQAQRRFVADASHELRTPLTSLEGLSEMLLMGADRGDSKAVQRMARSMHGELGRMTRLVSDLLTLSRLDSAAPLHIVPVDAGKLLDNIAEQMTPLAESREVSLVVQHGGPGATMVPADQDRLKQVILNLVDNALRYTPAGGTVRLSARHDATLRQVSLEVQDTGPGIGPGDLERIFDRFYRGDPSRARTTGNTGLGLAIARSIVKAHSGTIEAKSASGEGALFVITLPDHLLPAEPVAGAQAAEPTESIYAGQA